MKVETITFDSPLGSWTLATAPPPPDLASVVDLFWSVRGRVAYYRETILPSDRVELMFNLGLPHRVVQEPTGAGSDFAHAWISGLQEGPLIVEPQYDTSRYDSHLVAARLHPVGAHVLLGAPMRELANRVLSIDDAALPGTSDVREQLFEAGGVRARFRLLVRFIRRQLGETRAGASARVGYAVGRLRASGGLLPIRDLCDELDVTRKHLNAVFRREVGLTPKRMARLVKFSRLVDHLKDRTEVRWADIALALGYYDQSHFHREFRAFTGATPGEFLRARSADGAALLAEEPR